MAITLIQDRADRCHSYELFAESIAVLGSGAGPG
jgi:hypothetical protein